MDQDHRRLYDALKARDARFDGVFFVAVTSTRIYCRPICRVKTPKAVNCRFFATAQEAEHAGFRPCLRCRPETAPFSPAWNGSRTTVTRALDLIDEGALDGASVEALAARLGIGARHLCRLFRTHLDATPSEVAGTRRVQRAKRLLDETGLTLTEIALAAGFGSVRRFNAVFAARYGRPPSALRRRRRDGAASGNEARV